MEFHQDSEERRSLALSQGEVPPAMGEAIERAVGVPHSVRIDEQARLIVTLDGRALTFQTVDRLKNVPELDSAQFLKRVRETLRVLHIGDDLLHRAVNEGFSGGEKKRNEIFQMAVLEPKIAVLDRENRIVEQWEG